MTAGKEYNYTYENDVLVRAAEFTITVNADGLVTEKVPADTVTYTYNTDGKLVKKRILPADGAERLIYYEASDAEETIVRINTGERTVLFHGKTDSFGRKEFDEMQLGGKGYLSRQFSYHEGVITQEHEEKEKLKSSPTTSLVSRITFANGRTLSYEYDEEERITKVIDSLGETTEYTYDALGQLWTEKVNGVVVNDMEYDNYGNITKKNGIRYTYTDGQWKDLLTGYGSQTIAYDAQGNPTSYLGHTLTWEKGRQLKTFDNNTYTYNANGIRTGKTVNGVTHTYQLEGSGILRESWKENGHTYELIPLYDNENSVCGIIYENATYYFQKNLQGDVIALVDANAQVAARYTYDAWGSVTGVKTKDGAAITDTAHIAYVNPFRYRGYYLDRETGLYYLQSRYYDPVVGRWLNADEALLACLQEDVLMKNLYSYCENCAVIKADYSGYVSGGLIKVATYGGIACIRHIKTGEITVRLRYQFFDKAFCLSYAEHIIFAWGENGKYLGMDAERIAKELYGHAILFALGVVLGIISILMLFTVLAALSAGLLAILLAYAATLVSSLFACWLMEKSEEICINPDEPWYREKFYDLVW